MRQLFAVLALSAFAAVAQDKAAAPPAAGGAPAAAPAMPQPAPEMKVEWWFIGSWSCKGQQHAGPMGPEMPTETKLELRNTLGSFWLHVKGTAMSGPMKGKEFFGGYAGWDGTVHQRYAFMPGGMSHLTSKGWDGDKIVFDGDSMRGDRKMTIRHTITKKGDNEFASAYEIDGKPTLEETCTRSAKK